MVTIRQLTILVLAIALSFWSQILHRLRTMSRAFGIGFGWLKNSRASMPIYCVGALASVTAYYLISDRWIDNQRRIAIHKRKARREQGTESATDQYSSLAISGRFVNPFESWRDKTLWDFVRWLATRTSGNGLPKDHEMLAASLPLEQPHYALLNQLSNQQQQQQQRLSAEIKSDLPACYAEYPEQVNPQDTLTATWIGQSTCFVQMEGLNILTDPIFKRRTVYSWLGPERLRPAPCQLADLPKPDVVLVSHNHFDHLDIDVVRALGNSARWFVPLGLGPWFARLGVTNVCEMDWWQEQQLEMPGGKSFTIAATPTQHWSGRNGLDSNCTLWCSFLVRGQKASLFHCGDTGYCPAFEEVGKRYGPVSLAILPIGSYEPRWYMCHQHTNPEDAVLIHRDLRAKSSIGVHWGTFMMSDEHYLQPPRDLAEAAVKHGLEETEFIAPQLGRTYLYAAE
ncbi:hypothetical protein GGI07_001683 [Coemansia sp. Benny D115]|nr:hypothetical protein GGI07_001683 [Coemansia sp. Benny D115]